MYLIQNLSLSKSCESHTIHELFIRSERICYGRKEDKKKELKIRK